MHKFGRMARHLHATVPVPCNYSMLMSPWMNVLFTQELQCCTIYKNIYRVSCRKTNSEPFLFFWFGGNEPGQQERCSRVLA